MRIDAIAADMTLSGGIGLRMRQLGALSFRNTSPSRAALARNELLADQ